MGTRRIVGFKHFLQVLFAARVVLVGRPVSVKLVPNLAIFLLLFSFIDEWMR